MPALAARPARTAAPATRRSHAERSRATREHLIATAIEVVRERGFQGATVFEIAKAAGVTPGALQHHFGSKTVLMKQVVDEIMRASDAVALPLPEASVPLPERALRFVQALWSRIYEPPRFLAAWSLYFGAATDAELREHIVQLRTRRVAAMRERFAAAFPEAAGAPGFEVFVDLVLSSLRGIGVARLFGPRPPRADAQLRALAQMIVQHCEAAPVPARSRRRKTA
jgi:AcrR family transcriptional regulator